MNSHRFINISHELCVQAVLEAFDKKWLRRDFVLTASKYSGVSYMELRNSIEQNDLNVRLEIAEGIAYELEQRIEDLMNGDSDGLDLDPVQVFHRIDGISMKNRELASCCPLHQVFSHLMVLSLKPLFKSRFLPSQFASIPGKGQVALKTQVERWLRKTSLGINYAIKLDVRNAYKNTKKEVVMRILEKEIPKAKTILRVMDQLLSMSPGGGLIIGGYLEAWLFNFVASYALREIQGYIKIRRHRVRRLVIRVLSYMDDFSLFGSRLADLTKSARDITKWMRENLNLEVKKNWEIISFINSKAEIGRRKLEGAKSGCPGIDVAGFVIHRTYTTIRPKIFLKLRRQFLRAANDLKNLGHIQLWRARKIVSYYGYFKHTKSYTAAHNLGAKEIMCSAKYMIKIYAKGDVANADKGNS